MRQVFIENLSAGSGRSLIREFPKMAERRKLLGKQKGAAIDALFDSFEVSACPAQVGLGGRPHQSWAVTYAFEFEVEPDSMVACGDDASDGRLSAHDGSSTIGCILKDKLLQGFGLNLSFESIL